MRHLIAASLIAASLAACNLTDSHSREQRPSILRLAPEDSINFTAPDTVALNTDFTISVTTFGGSCDSKGPTDIISYANGNVDFRPFDVLEVTADRSCPIETHTFVHSGTLKSSAAGPKVITLFGRDWTGTMTSRAKTVIIK